jgi:hypothetical protein
MRTTSDPTEVKRVPGREYLTARNKAKLTIRRSRHRAAREIAANAGERRQRQTPLTPFRPFQSTFPRFTGLFLVSAATANGN